MSGWEEQVRHAGEQLERIASALERAAGIGDGIAVRPAGIHADWQSAHCFLWRRTGLISLPDAAPAVALADLACIDHQKSEVERNLAQFVIGAPANHMLLWGAKGTGKSSLLKAAAHELHGRGMKTVEIEKAALGDLPELIGMLSGRPERFLLCCDDLGFSSEEEGSRAVKAALDGSVLELPANVLFAATSNRRHLVPERLSDNSPGEELHPEEAVDERISLAERFGLWLSFHAFTQGEYLGIVEVWLRSHGMDMDAAARQAALRWALSRGSRSGRVAAQFARDWVGCARLGH